MIETDEDGQPLSRVELPADLLDWADEVNSTGNPIFLVLVFFFIFRVQRF